MLTVTITNVFGETSRQTYALEEGMRCRIGRDESCEISVPGESHLSRVHCILSYENGQLIIQDNQSSNGVFLNGERIVSDFLRLDEPYSLGDVTMVVSEGDAVGNSSSEGVMEPVMEEVAGKSAPDEGGGDREEAGTVENATKGEQATPITEPMSNLVPPSTSDTPPGRKTPEYPAQQTSIYGQQVVSPGYPSMQGGYGGQPVAPAYPQGYSGQVPSGYVQGYGVPQGYPNATGYPQPYPPYSQAGYGATPQGYPMGYPQPVYPQGSYPVNYPQQVYPGVQNYPVNSAYPQAYPVPQAQGYPYAPTASAVNYPSPAVAAQQQYAPQQYVPGNVADRQGEVTPRGEETERGEEEAEEVEEMSVEEQMADELEEREVSSVGRKWMDKARSSLSSGKETLRRWATGLLHKRQVGEEEEIWEEEQAEIDQDEELASDEETVEQTEDDPAHGETSQSEADDLAPEPTTDGLVEESGATESKATEEEA